MYCKIKEFRFNLRHIVHYLCYDTEHPDGMKYCIVVRTRIDEYKFIFDTQGHRDTVLHQLDELMDEYERMSSIIR